MPTLHICPLEGKLLGFVQKIIATRNLTGIVLLESSKRLDTADIILSGSSQSIYLERKSISDLISSVNGDRYKSQKARLQQLNSDTVKCGFIIEGSGLSRAEKEKVHNVSTSLMYKHNLTCHRTQNTEDTAEFVVNLCKKIDTLPSFRKTSGEDLPDNKELLEIQGGSVTGTMSKKGDLRKLHMFVHTLTLVNGVSIVIAQAIKNVYPTFADLWAAWQKSECAEFLLENIIISEKQGKVRKVSKKLSQQVFEAFNK